MSEELPRVDPNYEAARRKTVTPEALALIHNSYLRLALLIEAAVIVVLGFALTRVVFEDHHRPVPIRYITDTGRVEIGHAEMVSNFHPRDREVKYYMSRFIEGFFARERATLRKGYIESLSFLDQKHATALINAENRDHWIENFLNGNDPETTISIRSIVPQQLNESPYRVVVEFDKNFEADGQTMKTETWYTTVTFFADFSLVQDGTRLARINPLGFFITNIQQDKTFLPDSRASIQ